MFGGLIVKHLASLGQIINRDAVRNYLQHDNKIIYTSGIWMKFICDGRGIIFCEFGVTTLANNVINEFNIPL